MLGALGVSSAAAPNLVLNTGAWVTDGSVYAVVTSGDTTYIGGMFNYVGPVTGCSVPIDASTGQPLAVFPKVYGGVWARVSDEAGGWYIGGDFGQVGTTPRNNIAHILSDGSVDADWNPNANSWVEALVLSGSTLYVGGQFTSIGGQTRNHIAALEATTGNATDWDPNANGAAYRLTVSGATLYASGTFTSIGGQTRHYIAALDATTGNATAWNPNPENPLPEYHPLVLDLAVSGTTVYACGRFTSIGGQTRHYIAALDATTGNATAWNPNVGYPVDIIAVSGTALYAAGGFITIDGQFHPRFAQFDFDTDGDGFLDYMEGTDDPDNDGIPNFQDTDSDNDTVPDAVERAFHTDPYDVDAPTVMPLAVWPLMLALMLASLVVFRISRKRHGDARDSV
jgi:predicted small secreted protein